MGGGININIIITIIIIQTSFIPVVLIVVHHTPHINLGVVVV